jgi:FemAB-related protein (PEP-CTERM system-associated)
MTRIVTAPASETTPAQAPIDEVPSVGASIPEVRLSRPSTSISTSRLMPNPPAVRVDVAASSDRDRWVRYVDAHPEASVFHRWEWRGILANTFGHVPHYLIASRGGEVSGVLPLAEVRSLLFGRALVSLPFCSWAGPIASDDQSLTRLDEAASALADCLGARRLEYRWVGEPRFGRPAQDLYVRFAADISADHEVNLKAVPRKQRAMIRKGIAHSLTSAIESVASFYPLYADNVHRHGTPGCPPRFFNAIAEAFGADCEVLVVRNSSGAPLSAVLSLYHQNEILPFYAGDLAAARGTAANDFKYWEVMRRAVDRGARRFNFGRSKRGTGSFDFKRNWGFEPTPLSYEYRLADGGGVPQIHPANPKYRMVIAAWRRLPRWVVNAAGPVLVRSLG